MRGDKTRNRIEQQQKDQDEGDDQLGHGQAEYAVTDRPHIDRTLTALPIREVASPTLTAN